MVEKHTELLGNITVLDISYCLKITFKGVEAFGKHCKSLTHLKRNMPPPEWEEPALAEASKVNDTKATIIADTMTGLRHLELCFGCFGDNGLNFILTKCKKLAYLGIQGVGMWSSKVTLKTGVSNSQFSETLITITLRTEYRLQTAMAVEVMLARNHLPQIRTSFRF
ncbi:hypothetical protein Acr_00g0021400 [Actinidia rufa]|uniref:RNI-like superfamily protein n=1 Tax=Actinidia rufa TaxID=165716 RepID=A0A7J0DCE7_9ERIC|nr:hypothetical protein Acr_00g0021400 [Actinidia rufa]